jgi:hypothetical protein
MFYTYGVLGVSSPVFRRLGAIIHFFFPIPSDFVEAVRIEKGGFLMAHINIVYHSNGLMIAFV